MYLLFGNPFPVELCTSAIRHGFSVDMQHVGSAVMQKISPPEFGRGPLIGISGVHPIPAGTIQIRDGGVLFPFGQYHTLRYDRVQPTGLVRLPGADLPAAVGF